LFCIAGWGINDMNYVPPLDTFVEQSDLVKRLKPIADSIFKEQEPIMESSLEWKKIFECFEYSENCKPYYGCFNFGLNFEVLEADSVETFEKRVKCLIQSIFMRGEVLAARVLEDCCIIGISRKFKGARKLDQLSFDNALKKVSLLKRKPVSLIVSRRDYDFAVNKLSTAIEVILNHYIKTGYWFIKTNDKEGLRYYKKELAWFFSSGEDSKDSKGKKIYLNAYKSGDWVASNAQSLVHNFGLE
jgi:hypothetical protein